MLRATRGPPVSGLAELVDSVDQALESADTSCHRRMLLGVTDLLVGMSSALSDAHVATFDQVLGRLITGAEVEVRRAVAEHVSQLPKPPRGLVRRLAADPAGPVAGPILSSTIAIPDAALIGLVRSRSQEHLAAIAQREALSEEVCDAVADRGDDAVLCILLANTGAQLSDRTLSLVVTRIVDDDDLASSLGRRADLDPRRRAALLRERRYERARSRMNGSPHSARSCAKAEAAVALRIKIGLDGGDVEHWLSNGRVTEALLALAHLAQAPVDQVLAAHASGDLRRMTLIVRCAGLRAVTLARFAGSIERFQPGRDLGRILAAFRTMSVEQARAALDEVPLAGGP